MIGSASAVWYNPLTWFGVKDIKANVFGVTIPTTYQQYTNEYKVVKQDGNESFANVNLVKQDNQTDIEICYNFKTKQVCEDEECKKTKEVSSPEKLSFKKGSNSLLAYVQPDLDKKLIKKDSKSLKKDEFEDGDKYCYTYTADPRIDKYLKFGENSIEIILSDVSVANSYLQNVRAENNFTHLSISDSNLMLYMPFDADLAVSGLYEAGQIGQTLNFPGLTTRYVAVPYSASLGVRQNYTIMFWMKPNDDIKYAYKTNQRIMEKGDDLFFSFYGGDTGCNGNGELCYFIKSNNAGACAVNTANLETDWVKDTWYHITAVHNATNTIIYMDGVQDGISACTSVADDDSLEMRIGSDDTPSAAFNGSIDEYRIFNRVLSPTEINSVYTSEASGHSYSDLDTNGLVLDLDFDYDLADDSGNGNTGRYHSLLGTAVYDYSSNNNDGVTSGSSRVIYSGSGLVGGSYEFIGDSTENPNYIQVADGDEGGMSDWDMSSGDWSVSFWAKSGKTNYAQNAYAVNVYDYSNSDRAWAVKVDAADDQWSFTIYNTGSSSSATCTADSGTAVSASWQHIVATFDDTNNDMDIYINGVDIDSSCTSNPETNDAPLWIGSLGPGYGFVGLLDEVVIWKNVALTQADVDNLYASQYPTFYSQGNQTLIQNFSQNGSYNKMNVTIQSQQLNSTYINATGWYAQIENNVGYLETDANLVGHWRLDADGVDSSPNTYEGVVTGNLTNVSGKVAGAFGFKAEKGYISILDGNDLDEIRLGADYSVSAWVYILDGDELMIFNDVNATGDRCIIQYDETTASIEVGHWNGASYGGKAGVVSKRTWYNAVMLHDGTTSVNQLYLNGVLQTGTTAPASSSTRGTHIGIYTDKSTGSFNGTIDDVMVFSRKLTEQEIKSMYGTFSTNYQNDGTGIDWTESGDGEKDMSGNFVNFSLGTSANYGLVSFMFYSNDYGSYTPLLIKDVGFSFWEAETGGADTTSPYFTTIPEDVSSIYGNGLGVLFEASDETEFDSYAINWTDTFEINSTGYLTNSSPIGVGHYAINITINDTSNNMNSTLFNLEINQSTTQTLLTFDKESPQDYLTEITATCEMTPAIDTPTLTNATSGLAITFGADNWFFNCSYAGNQNYTASSNDSYFEISQIIPVLNIDASPDWSIDNATEFTITGSGCPTQLFCALNNYTTSNITNPYVNTYLEPATYEFVYNTTGNQNYTIYSVSNNLTISAYTLPPVANVTATPPCKYRKFGYYNKNLPWFREETCI